MKRSGFKRRWGKYNAKKTWADNILFDSQMEANHYQELRMLEQAGIISDLETQKELVLTVNGFQICIYYADFFYKNNELDRWTVGETKGKPTPEWKLKFKLCQALYPELDYRVFSKRSVVL